MKNQLFLLGEMCMWPILLLEFDATQNPGKAVATPSGWGPHAEAARQEVVYSFALYKYMLVFMSILA